MLPTAAAACAARGLGGSPSGVTFSHLPLRTSMMCTSLVAPASRMPASRHSGDRQRLISSWGIATMAQWCRAIAPVSTERHARLAPDGLQHPTPWTARHDTLLKSAQVAARACLRWTVPARAVHPPWPAPPAPWRRLQCAGTRSMSRLTVLLPCMAATWQHPCPTDSATALCQPNRRPAAPTKQHQLGRAQVAIRSGNCGQRVAAPAAADSACRSAHAAQHPICSSVAKGQV